MSEGEKTPTRARLLLAVVALVAGVSLGAWILFGQANTPFAVDLGWAGWVAADPSDALVWFSLALNWLGGGWFAVLAVPLGVALILVLRRRPWAALFFVVAEAASAGAVQVLKRTIGRARPEEIIVTSDFGSFPSGHVANAATIAAALFIIWPHMWAALAGVVWTLLMAFSRTYVGAHWLSDTLGGALIGAGVGLVVAVAFAHLLDRENRARRLPPAP